MDETAHEIEVHIDRTRERLGSHLRELEERVDAATDWREHFRQRPHLFLGAAVVGGALLATVLRPRSERDSAGSRQLAHGPTAARAQALDFWNNLKGALVGVVGARITDYIGALVPDFDEHYRRTEQRVAASDPATVSRGRTIA